MAIDKYELDVEDLLESFEELDDPRFETNRKHPLPSVLMIAVMGGYWPAMAGRLESRRGLWKKRSG